MIYKSSYLGDFLISVVVISDESEDIGGGDSDDGGGDKEDGDKVLPSSACSNAGLYPICIKLEMCRNNNNQAVSTYILIGKLLQIKNAFYYSLFFMKWRFFLEIEF